MTSCRAERGLDFQTAAIQQLTTTVQRPEFESLEHGICSLAQVRLQVIADPRVLASNDTSEKRV